MQNPAARNPFFAGLQNQIIQAAIQRQKQAEEEQKARLQQIHPAFRPTLPMFPFGQPVGFYTLLTKLNFMFSNQAQDYHRLIPDSKRPEQFCPIRHVCEQ